jgi:hypothetical protein
MLSWFKCFEITVVKLKNKVTFMNCSSKHVKHNVVWWYITFWAHNTSWPIQKDSYTLHIIWSTLVWPNFVKLKGNSKFIRKIWNLSHLAYSLSKMRHRVWWACPSTPNEILMVSHTCYVQVIIRITYKLVRKSRFPFF